jgi:hypothetical protein
MFCEDEVVMGWHGVVDGADVEGAVKVAIYLNVSLF